MGLKSKLDDIFKTVVNSDILKNITKNADTYLKGKVGQDKISAIVKKYATGANREKVRNIAIGTVLTAGAVDYVIKDRGVTAKAHQKKKIQQRQLDAKEERQRDYYRLPQNLYSNRKGHSNTWGGIKY